MRMMMMNKVLNSLPRRDHLDDSDDDVDNEDDDGVDNVDDQLLTRYLLL